MTIVLTGGGSGGHITPLLAVAHELKLLRPDVKLIYIGQRGDSLGDIPGNHPDIDQVYTIRAGKYRRYSGEKLKQLLDLKTKLKNTRDLGRVVRGFLESYRLLRKIKPDVIFIKGGFVGVPVGIAASRLHIPFITHDSDAEPGLANRIISRWASVHAVALSKEVYPYPQDQTFSVGVPINHHFIPVSTLLQDQYKSDLSIPQNSKVICVTGGGNGAKLLNEIVVNASSQLLGSDPSIYIVHLAGRAHTTDTERLYKNVLTPDQLQRVIVRGFVDDLYRYSGAADLIIGRGSATNLAEFAMQGKACVIVPAHQLPWTVKNTEVLAKDKAVAALDENDLIANPNVLASLCSDLLASPDSREQLSEQLSKALVHSNSSRELAELILSKVS